MALLMGGALVLIAASAGILVVGWLNANPTMIVTSMAGLLGAGLLLLSAFVRSRRIAAAAAAGSAAEAHLKAELAHAGHADGTVPDHVDAVSSEEPDPGATWVAPLPVPGAPSATTPVNPAEELGGTGNATTHESEPVPEELPPKQPARKKTAQKKTATKAAASKGSAKGTRSKAKTAGTAKTTTKPTKQPPKVVVFDGRDKYHRPGCRFAKGRGGERVTKATARRWGYEPCSVCDP